MPNPDALGPPTNMPAFRERERDKKADRLRRMDKETKQFHGIVPMRGAWSGGKGDRPRPVDDDRYRENFDRAFGKCSEHPNYKAKRKPTADCMVCRRLWREAQLKETNDDKAYNSHHEGGC